jgi:carbonic anhydrase/acetyltransferase-like protein (isoleucine patch superfamily)
MVLGSPAKIKTHLSDEQQLMLMHNADHYVGNAKRFSKELQEQE